MALEAIQEIRRAEEDARRLCQEAEDAGRQLVSKASQDGLRAVEDARRDAQAQCAVLLSQAEEEALGASALALDEAEQSFQAFRQQALGRLDRAAALIVERVVNGSCPS